MAKLRNLLALIAVALHLAALLVPATAHAAMDHAAGSHDEIHAQADHHAQPDELCCATADSDAPHASHGFCAICALSCPGMQATLAATGPLPAVLSATRQAALADATLRSATPEAARKPPRPRS